MCTSHARRQEDENMHLAARNSELAQRIAELEALAEAAEAAAQAYQQQQLEQQQQQAALAAAQQQQQEPATPAHLLKTGLQDGGAGGGSVKARATTVLKRAADARRLSGMYEVRRSLSLSLSLYLSISLRVHASAWAHIPVSLRRDGLLPCMPPT
jgi:hypothetical protein